MNVTAAITLGLAIAGFIGGIIWKVADLSVRFGRMTQKVEQNELRDKEEREHASVKFAELYNRMGQNESVIAALTNNVNTLTNTCGRIETKLDRLIEREGQK